MPTRCTEMLAGALKRWCDAIINNDFDAASIAEHIHLYAQIVIVHPEFTRRWERECPDIDANQVRRALTIAMRCITEMNTSLASMNGDSSTPSLPRNGTGS